MTQKLDKWTRGDKFKLAYTLANDPDEGSRLSAKYYFPEFIRQAWPQYRPNEPYIPNWHIDLIGEYLQCVSMGLIRRLAINIVPRYMKSTITSVFYPCWEWINTPWERYAFASYSLELSRELAGFRKDLLSTPWYIENFGDLGEGDFSEFEGKLSAKISKADLYVNAAGGRMFSTSVGGTFLGKGGNKIIIDDPTDPKRIYSTSLRDAANTWYSNVALNRLDDKIKGAIILVQQRQHDEDMTGYVTGVESKDLNSHVIKAGDWTILRLPAICEEDEYIYFPIADEEILRKRGNVLWAKREPLPLIREQERALKWHFGAVYQQKPSTEKGLIFNREWFKYYKAIPKEAPNMVALSVDSTYEYNETSAYTVLQVWARYGLRNYLLDEKRDKMSFLVTVTEIENLIAKYPQIRAKLIELPAGAALVNVLSKKYSGVIEVKPKVSKEQRAFEMSPIFQSGHVWVPIHENWVSDWVNEVVGFPTAKYKDRVDAATQMLWYFEEKFGPKSKNAQKDKKVFHRFVFKAGR